jgi:predicted alpha/beta-hydrolase family hydrolase
MKLLFAHGAGLGSSAPWMTRWAERLRALGPVTTFDYPYMARGSKAPDRLPKLIEAHRTQLHAQPGSVLVGKSMGSRVGCHLSLEEPVPALVCLGFPLRTIKGAVRDEVLLALRTPVLFVQGTRDRMGPLDLFDSVRAKMKAPSAIHIVEAGNHSLEVTKRSGIDQDASDAAAMAAITAFLAEFRR